MPVIVGAPRSGTTLLRFMLDSHPDLAIPPETGFLALASTLNEHGEKLREQFFQSVINHPAGSPGWKDFGIEAAAFRAALAANPAFSVAEGYRTFYRLYAERFGKPRWGEKTPIYAKHIAVIRDLLPEARFIHVIRDGRDAALSLRGMWFSPGWRIETQAAHWREFVQAARTAGKGHPDYLEIRYEDLVLKTCDTLKQICAFIDLDYDEAMLRYYTRAAERLKEHQGRYHADGTTLLTQEQRLSQQRRTTEPPDPSRVFAWKSEMSVQERMRFSLVAGGLLKELGYER
jgi:hypothetical protein